MQDFSGPALKKLESILVREESTHRYSYLPHSSSADRETAWSSMEASCTLLRLKGGSSQVDDGGAVLIVLLIMAWWVAASGFVARLAERKGHRGLVWLFKAILLSPPFAALLLLLELTGVEKGYGTIPVFQDRPGLLDPDGSRGWY